MNNSFINQFPLWAIFLAAVACFFPTEFSALKPGIVPLLALVMFAMGMTLTAEHFLAVLKKPKIIVIGVAIQFLLMPLFAYVLSEAFKLPTDLLIGMVLVGSTAGGTASNVICYLGNGNVALSILMTLTSTLCAVFLMPALTYIYLSQSVPVPVFDMFFSILIMVVIPVLLGAGINTVFGQQLKPLQAAFPVISSLAIIVIIAIIAGLNQHNISQLSLPLLGAVVAHNGLGLLFGYVIPKYLNYDQQTCRTVAIEVGMQNSGLSVALAIKYFNATAALPGAIFSIWHNISGSLLASRWRKTLTKRRQHYCK